MMGITNRFCFLDVSMIHATVSLESLAEMKNEGDGSRPAPAALMSSQSMIL